MGDTNLIKSHKYDVLSSLSYEIIVYTKINETQSPSTNVSLKSDWNIITYFRLSLQSFRSMGRVSSGNIR